MSSGVLLVLGVSAIIALTVLGVAVIFIGGKMRATKDTLELDSEKLNEEG